MKIKIVFLGILLFGSHDVLCLSRLEALRILGLGEDVNGRSVTEKDIRDAYKKLAVQYHPDKFRDRPKEEQAEKENKFKEIGAAYEVLTKKGDSAQDVSLERIQRAKEIVADIRPDSSDGKIRGIDFFIDKYLKNAQRQRDYPDVIKYLEEFKPALRAILQDPTVDGATIRSEINDLFRSERQIRGMGAVDLAEQQRREQEERDSRARAKTVAEDMEWLQEGIMRDIVFSDEYSLLSPIPTSNIPAYVNQIFDQNVFKFPLTPQEMVQYKLDTVRMLNAVQADILPIIDALKVKIQKILRNKIDDITYLMTIEEVNDPGNVNAARESLIDWQTQIDYLLSLPNSDDNRVRDYMHEEGFDKDIQAEISKYNFPSFVQNLKPFYELKIELVLITFLKEQLRSLAGEMNRLEIALARKIQKLKSS